MNKDLTPKGYTGKHTPGPWAYQFVPSSAEERAGPRSEWTGLYIGPEDDDGVSVYRTIFEGGIAHGPEDGDPEADARLIAAAPDGLALAYAVAAHFEGTDAPLGKQARDLISKATGEQP